MSSEIHLISDGDGVAVIGSEKAVEAFLDERGLQEVAVAAPRLAATMNVGSVTAKAGSEAATNSGRWLKLTEDSAARLKEAELIPTSTPGVNYAMLGKPGRSKPWLQVVSGPGSKVTNPALLAGAAGVMAQLAMQQAASEVTAYLATIDRKVDALIRSQHDTILADMMSVELLVDDAMAVREAVGHVSAVTWSKLHNAPATLAQVQLRALQELAALVRGVEGESRSGAAAKESREAEHQVRRWLGVLATTFKLHDEVAILELDRVLQDSPEEVNAHRLGLKAARDRRLAAISEQTLGLVARIDAVASQQTRNREVLTHPSNSRAIVGSGNVVSGSIAELREGLGIETERDPIEARRWRDGVAGARDKALESGRGAARTATDRGQAVVKAGRSRGGELYREVAEKAPRRRR